MHLLEIVWAHYYLLENPRKITINLSDNIKGKGPMEDAHRTVGSNLEEGHVVIEEELASHTR